MKKLKLDDHMFDTAEILSRSELRKFIGSDGSGVCQGGGGCPPFWHPEICQLGDPNCPGGTIICVDENGCP